MSNRIIRSWFFIIIERVVFLSVAEVLLVRDRCLYPHVCAVDRTHHTWKSSNYERNFLSSDQPSAGSELYPFC